MNYTIEYARQFIRSEEGITPCWLAGDNNVTEFRGKYERRARDWSCFCNMLGVSEDEIMERVKAMTGGNYQEHWKRNGKWVDDKGLLNWAKNGIKSAASIEDILQRNPDCCGAVRCYAVVWRESGCVYELDTCLNTTEAFDNWIRRYRDLVKCLAAGKSDIFPCVDFGTEKIRQPINQSDDARFCIRRKHMYLAEVTMYSTRWDVNADSALTFSYDEATKMIKRNSLLSGATLVKAPDPDCIRAIIQITDGANAGYYVGEVTRNRIRTSYKENAHRYSSRNAAQQALKRILKRFPKIIAAEVVTL